MNLRTTTFDVFILHAAESLNAAIQSDTEHPIPERYVNAFCDIILNSLWRNIRNSLRSMELYGNTDGFIFNMGGYIDNDV